MNLSRNIYIILTLITLIFLFNSCNSKKEDKEYKIAESYVNSVNYKMVSYKGIKNEYILTKKNLAKPPYYIIWGMQDNIDIKDFLNKKVSVIELIVTDHPLMEKIKNYKYKSIRLYLLLVDDNIVGGYSTTLNSTDGGLYSINGNTLEEKTGMSFQKWRAWWIDLIDSLED